MENDVLKVLSDNQNMFNKALGYDDYNGLLIAQNDTIRVNCVLWATKVLNRDIPIPECFSKQKFIALSKKYSVESELDKIRLICVNSHSGNPSRGQYFQK